jgi:hypothetical protein
LEKSLLFTTQESQLIAAKSPSKLNDPSKAVSELKIYPNPCQGRFTLSISHSAEEIQVTICNKMGAIIYQSIVHSNKPVELDLSFLNKGIYLVSALTSKEKLTKKMIIK